MARPLRIEFPGAVYHVTSRGDRREPIFVDDSDRAALLDVAGHSLERFDAQMLAYCLMGNHYHFVIHTRRPNLSQLMRQINGVYTQAFNRRHAKVGHLFQGRFKAILVDRENYLFDLCRYVELNPVRAKILAHPGDWPWSSYAAHAGLVGLDQCPDWLDVAGLHGFLLGRAPQSAADHRRAAQRYAKLVADAPDVRLWDEGLRQQIYLGDEAFVERMQEQSAHLQSKSKPVAGIPTQQRRRPRTIRQWLQAADSREQGIYDAHTQGAHTMSAIAEVMGVSVSRISRLIAAYEAQGKTRP
jgi:putative transposase